MLKETPQSLRLYFGLVAAFSLFSGVMAIYRAGSSPLVLLLSAASIVFGVLFAYIVIRFAELVDPLVRWVRKCSGGLPNKSPETSMLPGR